MISFIIKRDMNVIARTAPNGSKLYEKTNGLPTPLQHCPNHPFFLTLTCFLRTPVNSWKLLICSISWKDLIRELHFVHRFLFLSNPSFHHRFLLTCLSFLNGIQVFNAVKVAPYCLVCFCVVLAFKFSLKVVSELSSFSFGFDWSTWLD